MVSNTGATVQAQSILYKAIVQSGLLYDSESWVVTWSMIKVIEGFHYRVARRITGMTARRTMTGEWEWPLVAEALETSEIW